METQLQCLTPNAGHRSRLHFISQTQQKVRTSYKSTIHARIITNLPGWAYTTPKCDMVDVLYTSWKRPSRGRLQRRKRPEVYMG